VKEFYESDKEQRERGRLVDGNLHLLDGDLPKTLASSGGVSVSAARWRDLASEREWEGGEWATGEASREGLGFYTGSLAQGARCTLRTELDGGGSVSGRRCEPSPGVGVAVSVA
jgi:hypothetical protein